MLVSRLLFMFMSPTIGDIHFPLSSSTVALMLSSYGSLSWQVPANQHLRNPHIPEHSTLIGSYFPCRSSLHDINIKRNCRVLILNPTTEQKHMIVSIHSQQHPVRNTVKWYFPLHIS